MRVICQKQKALESVRIAQHAVTSTTLPVLSYLLLHAREGVIEVQATNLETTICSLFEATIEEEGSVCLPGGKFYSILRELPEGRFYLEAKENKTFVKMGEISFTLLGIPREEFPEISRGGEVMFHLPQKTLLEVLAKTMFSAGQDEVRQNLNCVLFEAETPMEEADGKFALRAVSTDGRRLSLFNLPEPAASASFKVLLPLKAARQLSKILHGEGEIGIGIEENSIFFQTSNFSFTSQLIDAKFPDYKGVIPKEYKIVFEAARENLIDAIRRVSLLSDQQTRLVRFNVKEDSLILSSASSDFGSAQEKLPISLKGEKAPMEIGFNAVYLLEGLRAIEGEKVEIGLIGEKSPAVFSSKTSANYLYLLMPVKLTED